MSSNKQPPIYHLISPEFTSKREAEEAKRTRPEYKCKDESYLVIEKRRERIGAIGSKDFRVWWGIFYTTYK